MKTTALWLLGIGALVWIRFGGEAEFGYGESRLKVETIAAASGTRATATDDGVIRIAWARSDVPVKVDGMPSKPFAGLNSWAAFTPAPHGAMVMGDTAVFQDEVTPAMDAAFANGLEVTGLHNDVFYDEPKVYFMHIVGTGDPATLAVAVKSVWDAIKKVRADRSMPADRLAGTAPVDGQLDRSLIAAMIGHKTQLRDGVVKVTIGRGGMMHGVSVGGSMGLATRAAFSGSDQEAAIEGDFLMTAAEVQPVLRAMRKVGFNVVAVHSHMVGEIPAFYFAHFWCKGPAEDLARGFRAVLDEQALIPSPVMHD